MKSRRAFVLLCVALIIAVIACWLVMAESRSEHLLGLYSFRCLLFNVSVTYLAFCAMIILRDSSRRRRRIFAFLALTISGMFALGLIELSTALGLVDYRVVFDTPVKKAWENPRNVIDPELLHIHRPYDEFSGSIPGDLVGWLGIKTSRRYDVSVRYDGNGFRNADDLEKAKIVLIGDSFVEGSIVLYESIASTRLSKMLATPVLNLGQTGYGPQQVAATLRRFGFSAQPQTVIWVLFEGNDLTHDYRRYESLGGKPEEFVARYHSLWARSFLRNSLLRLDRLVHNPQTDRSDTGKERSGILSTPGEWNGQRVYFGFESQPLLDNDVRSLNGARQVILGVAQECRQRDINFVLVFAPIKFRVLHDMVEFAPGSVASTWVVNDLDERMEQWALEEGVAYLDLTPALRRAASNGSLGYYLDDGHWNATGHEVAATQIASFLRQLD